MFVSTSSATFIVEGVEGRGGGKSVGGGGVR